MHVCAVCSRYLDTQTQWEIQEEILGRTGSPWGILDQVHNTCAKLGQQQGEKTGMLGGGNHGNNI